ncbi:YbaB/EbfC family nucleoid-associated protein [Lentzea aerocolonigenes]|uniref:YbaB/EbfC family nucleoid-associated protein n=1 Tax=Lentzea aerocolonigenes TaxID=68170 RepID=UPI000AB1DEA9|nr:YbaB/EbfC family nucleoid-associated protein [Lentzea aerocolonigenes]
MNPEQMIADLESKAQQLQQRSQQLQEQIQQASSTATSPNEAVTVRVAPNGPDPVRRAGGVHCGVERPCAEARAAKHPKAG